MDTQRGFDNSSQNRLRIRLKGLFSTTYLTLISIIQGVAFGYLAPTLAEAVHRRPLNLIECLLVLSSVLMIVAVWYEYCIGATTFVWIPRTRDALIPFFLGVSEIILFHSIELVNFSESSMPGLVEGLQAWCINMAILVFVGLCAAINELLSAKAFAADNQRVLNALGIHKSIFIALLIAICLVFATLAIVTPSLSQPIGGIMVGVISLSALLLFLLRARLFWRRVIETSR